MWNFRAPSACSQRLGFSVVLAILLTVALPYAAQAAAVSTTTTLVLSSSTVASPAAVTLTASVVGGGAPVTTGTITFCDAAAKECQNSSIVGTAQLTGTPAAAVIKIIPAIGVHTYVAKFSATTTAAASTSASQTLTVTGKNPTSTTLVATGNLNGYGLTATVVGVAGHPPLLSGTVSFQDTTDGNYVLGTASLGAPTFAQSFTQAPLSPFQTINGVNPAAIGAGDFDGDGIPDLAIMDAGQNALTFLRGNGDGTFTFESIIYDVGSTPCNSYNPGGGGGASNCSIAVGDFNQDGKPDLAVTSDFDNEAYVFLNLGGFTFAPGPNSPIAVGNFPVAVRIGDFNRDGLLDLVVANMNDDTLSILLGNGEGTFTPAATLDAGLYPFYLAVADFNGDGIADVAATNEGDSTVTVMLGNGDGTFTPAPTLLQLPPGSYAPGPIVAADFNGDSIVDLAVANFTPTDQSPPAQDQISNVVIELGNGDGTFTNAPGSPVSEGLNPVAMAAADFNQDGNTDLAVVNLGVPGYPQTWTLTLLLGDGNGGFASAGTEPQLGFAPSDVAAADFNGDGTIDLAIPNVGDSDTTILLNYITQTETASVSNITIAGSTTHYADAVYLGNTYFAPSTSNTVPLQGMTVPTTLTLTANPTQQLNTMAVTFTAQLATTANPPPTENPTGSITFLDGGTVLGTASLNASGQAVYTTASLGDGVHSITATYGGDPSYLATTSNAVSITTSDLQVTRLDKTSPIVLPGTTVTYTLQVAPQVASTFLYNTVLTASGLPAGATATFSPATVSAGGGTTMFTLTINTAAATAMNRPPASPRLPLALGLLLPIFGAIRFRRRLRSGMLPLLLLAILSLSAIAGLSGCSGAGLFAARKVAYSVTVTATEGTLQRSAEVPLAIQ